MWATFGQHEGRKRRAPLVMEQRAQLEILARKLLAEETLDGPRTRLSVLSPQKLLR
jgi:hypothetical protein